MDKVLVFSPDQCTGCALCEVICSLVHTQTCNPARSRIRVLTLEQKGLVVQTFCQQCEDAACVAACPVSAITNDEILGTIDIDRELCIDCEDCIAACPYNGIYWDDIGEKIIACDLCGGDPKCVTFCETGAIEFLVKDAAAIQKKERHCNELGGLFKLVQAYTDGPAS